MASDDPTDDKMYENVSLEDFMRHFAPQVESQQKEIEDKNLDDKYTQQALELIEEIKQGPRNCIYGSNPHMSSQYFYSNVVLRKVADMLKLSHIDQIECRGNKAYEDDPDSGHAKIVLGIPVVTRITQLEEELDRLKKKL